MSPRASRRLLLIALALSLLLHLLLARVLHWPNPSESNEARWTHVHVVTIERQPPPPPPKPRPQPTPVKVILPKPQSKAVAHIVPKAPPLPRASTSQSSVANAGVTSAPSPESAVTSSPHPCTAPAAISVQPEVPDIAPDVRAQMTSGIARVLVHLDAHGAVLDANVVASTGNASLDLTALTMARGATYIPAYAGCKPVAGDYAFSVKFLAW